MIAADKDPKARSRKGTNQIVFGYGHPLIPGICHPSPDTMTPL